jgi:flavin reductase (DIM6/NTAB) family NADH-FMN oxidoreductase RutF
VSAFEEIVSDLDYPMTIVTASNGRERAGCLVGFSTQCSIDPSRYAVCLSKNNRTARVAADAPVLVVHLLRPGDDHLARLFGEATGDDVAKFDLCAWAPGPGGAPVLAKCDWFAGRVAQRIDVGDHVLHLLDVGPEGAIVSRSHGQLGFQAVQELEPGHPA